ncbi:MAG: allophanate hydrolase, partial [Anaerolineaceae bacterium]|nr:allophanate hydrolase [Anaerolineaceae bacterium]
ALPGLHTSRFTPEGLNAFWNDSYSVTTNSDRMGYRLQGETITHTKGADIVSQGMVLGTVQVPADGQPIVMMPDHPTTGGYTQIAVVAKADLPLIAQSEAGLDRVQFKKVTLEESHLLYTDLLSNLKHGIIDDMEDWMLL